MENTSLTTLLPTTTITYYYDDYNTSDDFVYLCDKTDVNRFGARVMPLFYYSIFMLSLFGNGLVLYIIFKFEKMNTVTNIFLLNLVISDLVFASSLPFWAVYHSSEWIFGRAICKIVGSVYFIGFYSSILFLTLMTFDRYLAVVHAITAAKKRRTLYAFVSSAVVWCVSFVATVKEFILYDVQENGTYGTLCEETGYSPEIMAKWQLVGYYQQLILFFLFPLVVVLYCYIRITMRVVQTKMKEKCRAVKLIFIIIVTFFICWTPYNVVIFLKTLQTSVKRTSDSCNNDIDYAIYVTRNIAYLYCCINPVFYTFVGKKFQSHFRNLLAKWIPCFRAQLLTSQSSKTTDQKSHQSIYE
ncbi:C-C chemokine receptor type 4 [Amia ocellicauda]|uniref:C-C chemokine receptor type 4 n=1 Tax=Amia ocellicauda TaxID=2972642 RepID=UPI0034640D3B